MSTYILQDHYFDAHTALQSPIHCNRIYYADGFGDGEPNSGGDGVGGGDGYWEQDEIFHRWHETLETIVLRLGTHELFKWK